MNDIVSPPYVRNIITFPPHYSAFALRLTLNHIGRIFISNVPNVKKSARFSLNSDLALEPALEIQIDVNCEVKPRQIKRAIIEEDFTKLLLNFKRV